MKNKKVFYLIVRIFISVFLLGLLVWFMRNNLNSFLQIIFSLKIYLFLVSIFFYIFSMFLCAFRLKFLFLAQDIQFSIWEVLKLGFIGQFFNNFMPSTIGGDVIKLYYAHKRSSDMIKPFSSIFIDRMLGGISLIFFAAASFVFWGNLIKDLLVKWIILGLFCLSILFLSLFFSKRTAKKFKFLLIFVRFLKLEDKLKKVYKTMSNFKNSRQTYKALIFSLGIPLLITISAYFVALSLSIKLPLYIFFILIPVIGVLSSLPSLNGLGIREGALVYFFRYFIKPELAFTLSILFLIQMGIISIIGGLVYLLGGSFKERSNEPSPFLPRRDTMR